MPVTEESSRQEFCLAKQPSWFPGPANEICSGGLARWGSGSASEITMPYAAEYPRFINPFRLPGVPLSAQVTSSLLSSACGLTWALEESD
eukprot:COSAG02_NODE_8323_length_2614_cov_2.804771_2_plen_90_part_00